MITLRFALLMSQRMCSSQRRFLIVRKVLIFYSDGLLATCPDSNTNVENRPLSDVRDAIFSKFGCRILLFRKLNVRGPT